MNYTDFVQVCLDAGDDPNEITRQIIEAIQGIAPDWVLWGDDMWRLDTVCSVCGSDYPGLCKHPNKAILRREYEAAKATEGAE